MKTWFHVKIKDENGFKSLKDFYAIKLFYFIL